MIVDKLGVKQYMIKKKRKEQEKGKMRCEVRKSDHIDDDFICTSDNTQVSHESLQSDIDDLTQNIIDHSTCSVARQVCVPQESTKRPCTVSHETASLDDEDNISVGEEDDSKDKINSPKVDKTTLKCVNNGKILCIM